MEGTHQSGIRGDANFGFAAHRAHPSGHSKTHLREKLGRRHRLLHDQAEHRGDRAGVRRQSTHRPAFKLWSLAGAKARDRARLPRRRHRTWWSPPAPSAMESTNTAAQPVHMVRFTEFPSGARTSGSIHKAGTSPLPARSFDMAAERDDLPKHLEFIQVVIERHARTSFVLKKWSLTIVSAVFLLSSGPRYLEKPEPAKRPENPPHEHRGRRPATRLR